MVKKSIVFIAVSGFAQLAAAVSACPVEFFLVEKGAGFVEVGLRNHMDRPYELRYDQLPWVSGSSGGVFFAVAIDGKRIQQAQGAGHNRLVIKLGAQSSVSSDIDVNYLKSFYRGIEPDRVSVTWDYTVPRVEGMDPACHQPQGKIATP